MKNKMHNFKEGDIIFSFTEGQYQPYKILKIEIWPTGDKSWHLLLYKPLSHEPSLEDVKNFEVDLWHTPIAPFENEATFLTNKPVKKEELEGYFIYLKEADFGQYVKESGIDLKELVHKATEYLKTGNQFSSEKKYAEAIQAYTDSIEAYPLYYEALDNRAFTKILMNNFSDAVIDLEQSLRIEPKNALAYGALAECHFYLKDYKKAYEEINKSLQIEDSPMEREWLGKIERAMRGDTDLMDSNGRATQKIFFVLRLVTEVKGKGSFGLIIHEKPTHKEGEPYSLYASRIMPGQAPKDAVDKVFTEDLRRPPKYKMGQTKFSDYAKDKEGKDIPRFDIYVLAEYFSLDGIKLAGQFASWMPLPKPATPELIAIFGPPGAGKSTMIELAKKKGIKAFDLEQGGNNYTERLENAKHIFEQYKSGAGVVLFGAADLAIEDFPVGTKYVMLIPPKLEYERRLMERDTKHPVKAGQGGLEYKYEDFEMMSHRFFDLVISKTLTKEETLEAILQCPSPKVGVQDAIKIAQKYIQANKIEVLDIDNPEVLDFRNTQESTWIVDFKTRDRFEGLIEPAMDSLGLSVSKDTGNVHLIEVL